MKVCRFWISSVDCLTCWLTTPVPERSASRSIPDLLNELCIGTDTYPAYWFGASLMSMFLSGDRVASKIDLRLEVLTNVLCHKWQDGDFPVISGSFFWRHVTYWVCPFLIAVYWFALSLLSCIGSSYFQMWLRCPFSSDDVVRPLANNWYFLQHASLSRDVLSSLVFLHSDRSILRK